MNVNEALFELKEQLINEPIVKDEDFCISLSAFINLNLYMP